MNFRGCGGHVTLMESKILDALQINPQFKHGFEKIMQKNWLSLHVRKRYVSTRICMTWGAHTFSSQWETRFACGVCSAVPKDRRASSSCAAASTKLRAAAMICMIYKAPFSQRLPVPTYIYRSSLVSEEQLQRVIRFLNPCFSRLTFMRWKQSS